MTQNQKDAIVWATMEASKEARRVKKTGLEWQKHGCQKQADGMFRAAKLLHGYSRGLRSIYQPNSEIDRYP